MIHRQALRGSTRVPAPQHVASATTYPAPARAEAVREDSYLKKGKKQSATALKLPKHCPLQTVERALHLSTYTRLTSAVVREQEREVSPARRLLQALPCEELARIEPPV